MRTFKDLNITPNNNSFKGNKINIWQLLNKKVIIKAYKIEKSKFNGKGNGNCLYMQIELDGVDHVVFTGSTVLMDTIQKVPADAFPFETIIVQPTNQRHYEFT